jgi:hypothetical protein
MEENKAQAKAAQEKHDELMRELGESKQTVAAVQSKVPFVSYPRILHETIHGSHADRPPAEQHYIIFCAGK